MRGVAPRGASINEYVRLSVKLGSRSAFGLESGLWSGIPVHDGRDDVAPPPGGAAVRIVGRRRQRWPSRALVRPGRRPRPRRHEIRGHHRKAFASGCMQTRAARYAASL